MDKYLTLIVMLKKDFYEDKVLVLEVGPIVHGDRI